MEVICEFGEGTQETTEEKVKSSLLLQGEQETDCLRNSLLRAPHFFFFFFLLLSRMDFELKLQI